MKVNRRSGRAKKPTVIAQVLLELTLPGNGDSHQQSSNVNAFRRPLSLGVAFSLQRYMRTKETVSWG